MLLPSRSSASLVYRFFSDWKLFGSTCLSVATKICNSWHVFYPINSGNSGSSCEICHLSWNPIVFTPMTAWWKNSYLFSKTMFYSCLELLTSLVDCCSMHSRACYCSFCQLLLHSGCIRYDSSLIYSVQNLILCRFIKLILVLLVEAQHQSKLDINCVFL